MNKIEVNHTPDFMNGLTILLTLLWGVFTFCACFIASEIALMLSMGFLFVIIGIALFVDFRKTIVEYDTQKIHWKWLCLDYTLNFADIDSFYYTIVSERTRYGYNRRFEVVFKVNDETLRLNDRLKTEDIENSISGNSGNIKLMQLYKFIENICPEKSEDFIKTD